MITVSLVVLCDSVLAMLFVILHSFWRSFPFVMLFLSAGPATIPHELYEVAFVDGAGPWRRFVSVTLPLTSNQLGLC